MPDVRTRVMWLMACLYVLQPPCIGCSYLERGLDSALRNDLSLNADFFCTYVAFRGWAREIRPPRMGVTFPKMRKISN